MDFLCFYAVYYSELLMDATLQMCIE
jgi:hypothetical protein